MVKTASISAPCKRIGNTCKFDEDCCMGSEVCQSNVCSSHNADPINYESGSNCVKTCSIQLPKDVKPYCYSNDEEHPNEIQFCAYEKNGVLISAEGCCDKICPSEQCPPTIAPSPVAPEKTRPQFSPYNQRKPVDTTNQPLPKLLKLLLILFAILVLSGIILSL